MAALRSTARSIATISIAYTKMSADFHLRPNFQWMFFSAVLVMPWLARRKRQMIVITSAALKVDASQSASRLIGLDCPGRTRCHCDMGNQAGISRRCVGSYSPRLREGWAAVHASKFRVRLLRVGRASRFPAVRKSRPCRSGFLGAGAVTTNALRERCGRRGSVS